MVEIRKISLVAILLMVLVSFTNLFGLNIAGISVFVGIAAFFTDKIISKQAQLDDALDIKSIGKAFKVKNIWIWVLLPFIMDIVSIIIAKMFVPEFITHLLARTSVFVSFDKIILMILQLAVLALGEEIAWRAFFQKQLMKQFPLMPVLIVTSILFSLGHLTNGSLTIVIYDIIFVAINSYIYGVIFVKTNSAWVSTISHFVANLLCILILLYLL